MDHRAESPDDQETRPHRVFQPSLFDEQNLGEITGVEEFPGERLIVCRNPLIGAQRARKREELLAATETTRPDHAPR